MTILLTRRAATALVLALFVLPVAKQAQAAHSSATHSQSAHSLATHSQATRPPVKLTVMSDGHPLALWMRAAAKPKGAIVLLHGRTWSALPDFDLQVPGEQLSVMQALVHRGYTVYALDARGYGATPRDSTGWLTPNRAASDVAAVLQFVAARHPGQALPTLVGWSYGSMVAHLTLQQHPTLASAVVLFGYPLRAVQSVPVSADTGAPLREVNTAKNAASDFIAPNAISPRAVEAYVAAALKADPVRSDWKALHQWNAVSPAALTVPTLLMHGELDPFAPVPAQAAVFAQLGSPDRQWIILAGGDHAALVEKTMPAFIAGIVNFIERPRLQ
jgi:pimeloyl-ACP methyl ester carboxylesterase